MLVCPGGRGRAELSTAERCTLPLRLHHTGDYQLPGEGHHPPRAPLVGKGSALQLSEGPLSEAVGPGSRWSYVCAHSSLFVDETTQELRAGDFSHSTSLTSGDLGET